MGNILSQKERCFIYLSAVFITAIIISNVLATKIWVIGGISSPAGIIAYPVTFLMTDVIGELWGKKRVYAVVWAGFACSIMAILLGLLAVHLPASPFYTDQEYFTRLFGTMGRITLASLCAYVVSQTHDIWLFHVIREHTGRGKLWIRNNVATIMSQMFDTVIFITIAFYGTIPLNILINMMLGQYLLKVIFALCDTPFCYALIAYCEKKSDCIDVATGRLIADLSQVKATASAPERADY